MVAKFGAHPYHAITRMEIKSMNDIAREYSRQGSNVSGSETNTQTLIQSCCVETIKKHAANNPMMVCGTCKQIIKCFTEEPAYRNYIRFCQSRHRHLLATESSGYLVVVFRKV